MLSLAASYANLTASSAIHICMQCKYLVLNETSISYKYKKCQSLWYDLFSGRWIAKRTKYMPV